jgi:DNA-directed RNA polymerase subunit E'/Rpb7
MPMGKEIVGAQVSKVIGMGFFAYCGPLDEIMLASHEMNGFEFQLVKVVTFNFWKDLFGNEIGVKCGCRSLVSSIL